MCYKIMIAAYLVFPCYLKQTNKKKNTNYKWWLNTLLIEAESIKSSLFVSAHNKLYVPVVTMTTMSSLQHEQKSHKQESVRK